MQINVMAGALLLGSAGFLAGVAARGLLGRMRRGARVRAPVCEVGVGALWAVAGAGWGGGLLSGRWVPALLGLAWLGIAAGVVDLRHRRLPDALTLPALGLAPVALLPLGAAAVERGMVAGLTGIAAYGGLHLVAPAAMGAGDVKLAGSLATVLGAASWPALLVAAGLSAAVTAALALRMLVVANVGVGGPAEVVARFCASASPAGGSTSRRQRARASPVPHGPSMLAAAWLVTLVVATRVGAG